MSAKLTTANQKYVIVADASKSQFDELEVPANLSLFKLGNAVSFLWDVGESLRPCQRLRDMLLEWNSTMDNHETDSQYKIWSFYKLIESFQVLVDNTLIYDVTSPEVDQAKMHLSRLQDKCKTFAELMSNIREDVASTGLFQPYTNAAYFFGGAVTDGASIAQCHNLSQFLPGILANLHTHRIKRVELRFKLRSYDASTVQQALSVSVNGAGTDLGREHLLPQFSNMKLRLRLETFVAPIPDPVPKGAPLILYHPRYELKKYVNAFASGTTCTVNLHNDFSPNSRIHRLFYYLELTSGQTVAEIVKHIGYTAFSDITVKFNGKIKEEYKGTRQIESYLSKQLTNEFGHPLLCLGDPSTGVNIFGSSDAFVPFLHFKGLNDPISHGVDDILLLSGKDNTRNFDEITFTTVTTHATTDFVCIAESMVVAQVFVDGTVKVSGK